MPSPSSLLDTLESSFVICFFAAVANFPTRLTHAAKWCASDHEIRLSAGQVGGLFRYALLASLESTKLTLSISATLYSSGDVIIHPTFLVSPFVSSPANDNPVFNEE